MMKVICFIRFWTMGPHSTFRVLRITSLLTLTLISGPPILAQGSVQTHSDFDKGLKLYNEARFNEAAESFKHIVERDRTNAEAYYYLGNSYFRMYRYEEAIKAYRQAIELKPDHLLAYNNLGTAYHSLRDFKSAREVYEKALQIKPDYSDAIFGLGVVYLELKDKPAALEQHKKLVDIDIERADKLYNYISDKKVSLPVLNRRAINLPQPIYPPLARTAHAAGVVIVWVSIDEDGKVISASALTGHPLLRAAALQAAKRARFSTTTENGRPVRVTGVIQYNFLAE
jgi:TonB family protein